MAQCPNDLVLNQFLGESLDKDRIQQIAAHIDGCASCQEKLQSLAKDDETGHWRELQKTTKYSTLRDDAAGRSSSQGAIHGRFSPGVQIARRYRIVSLVGKGGMGEVYRADDLKLGHTVALKFLPKHLAADPHWLEYFHSEVRLTRQISHPHVCRVHDIGEHEGQPFLSMEFIHGEDLAGLLKRIGRLAPDKGVQIAQQLCTGLAAAHKQGVIHRDLKPANIMLDGNGNVRITDFGLARLIDKLDDADAMSGTPLYMAPEQLAGREVTARSDLYALGLVMYEVFTGKRAYDGGSIDELRRQKEQSAAVTPSSITPDIDPDVERAILQCLEKEPQRRPESALAVAALLPGGDPLAAALAAGQTPSPQQVAAAGEKGVLSLRTGIALLSCTLIALTVFTLALQKTIMRPGRERFATLAA